MPRTITDAQVGEVVVRTLEETPEGATHWSKRELACADLQVLELVYLGSHAGRRTPMADN